MTILVFRASQILFLPNGPPICFKLFLGKIFAVQEYMLIGWVEYNNISQYQIFNYVVTNNYIFYSRENAFLHKFFKVVKLKYHLYQFMRLKTFANVGLAVPRVEVKGQVKEVTLILKMWVLYDMFGLFQ